MTEKLVERVKVEVELDVDVGFLSKQFAALTEDAMAQFFCFVAAELGPEAAGTQAWFTGRHLMTCPCSTDAGRDYVRAIVETMDQVAALRVSAALGPGEMAADQAMDVQYQEPDGMLP